MAVFPNVNELWQRISGEMNPNPVNAVAQRFLEGFGAHGVEARQIPRLLPEVKFGDLIANFKSTSAFVVEF